MIFIIYCFSSRLYNNACTYNYKY